jgi:hypothetical protein
LEKQGWRLASLSVDSAQGIGSQEAWVKAKVCGAEFAKPSHSGGVAKKVGRPGHPGLPTSDWLSVSLWVSGVVPLCRRMYGYPPLPKSEQAIGEMVKQPPSWGFWKVSYRLGKIGNQPSAVMGRLFSVAGGGAGGEFTRKEKQATA